MEEDPNTIRRGRGLPYTQAPKGYALTGKIMLSAIVILFTAVLLIFFVHVYVRCCLFRRRRDEFRRLRRDRSLLAHHHPNPAAASCSPRGLNPSVLRSLPVFVFSSKTHQESPECAVCLCEFEESEKGRLLPKCRHSFHIDCIDMWFHSHSTCPLCRSPVKPDSAAPLPPPVSENSAEITAGVGGEGESIVGSSSSVSCLEETGPSFSFPSGSGSSSSSSSSSSSGACSSSPFRKMALGLVGLGIEVPTRRGLEEVEIAVVSPGGQGLKSPGSRILSLKRILSRDRRAGVFSSSSSSPVTETDLERGEASGNQSQTQS